MATDDDFRPRRSVLFIPASNPRAMAKAASLECDAVILDLEDAVAPDAKDAARAAAVALVQAGLAGRELIVRCNGLDTPWAAQDLAALAAAGPYAVLAPKVRNAAELHAYDRALAGAPAHTRLWAMIETAQGVMNLEEIAEQAGATRLAALVLGPNDLALDLRLKPLPARAPLQPILSRLVIAARAHGLVALDGAYNAIDDLEAFTVECRQAAAFGFDGKTLIHPSQIEPANRAFSPSPQEITWARAVVEAFSAPGAAGQGALRLEGRMIERLHLAEAKRVLRLAG